LSNQKALVPVDTGQEIADTLIGLLDAAKDQVVAERGGHATADELEAEITHRMLCLSERSRSVQRSAQSFVVAYAARNQLWRFHPDGFRNLRQFIQAAGLTHSTVCDLAALGDILVPYFDEHAIPINPLLTDEHWAKLREAIPALRHAIKDNDEARVLTILADVRRATDRNAVRGRYRQRRQRYGHGTTLQLGDGRVLLVAFLDDEEAAQTVIRRLNGALEWDLVLNTSMIGGALKLVVNE
jgi:hypothetical protein